MSGHQYPHILGQGSASIQAGDRYAYITSTGPLLMIGDDAPQSQALTEQLARVAQQLQELQTLLVQQSRGSENTQTDESAGDSTNKSRLASEVDSTVGVCNDSPGAADEHGGNIELQTPWIKYYDESRSGRSFERLSLSEIPAKHDRTCSDDRRVMVSNNKQKRTASVDAKDPDDTYLPTRLGRWLYTIFPLRTDQMNPWRSTTANANSGDEDQTAHTSQKEGRNSTRGMPAPARAKANPLATTKRDVNLLSESTALVTQKKSQPSPPPIVAPLTATESEEGVLEITVYVGTELLCDPSRAPRERVQMHLSVSGCISVTDAQCFIWLPDRLLGHDNVPRVRKVDSTVREITIMTPYHRSFGDRDLEVKLEMSLSQNWFHPPDEQVTFRGTFRAVRVDAKDGRCRISFHARPRRFEGIIRIPFTKPTS